MARGDVCVCARACVCVCERGEGDVEDTRHITPDTKGEKGKRRMTLNCVSHKE